MPPELIEALKPEFIAPLVAFLCSEQSSETGGLFELGAGYYTKIRWQRTEGELFKLDDSFTHRAVAAKWDKVRFSFSFFFLYLKYKI